MAASPVEEWVKKAEDNYLSALDLAKRRRDPVPDVVCSQCQQSAEKYLKALMVRHHIEFPKTHDLRELEDLLIDVEPDVHLIDDHLHELNPMALISAIPASKRLLQRQRRPSSQ